MARSCLIESAAPFLPYGRQSIDESDIASVVDVLRSDWLTTGPAVEAFETAFAGRVDARHAAACANGTAALHLAAMALGLGPGDMVIAPAITFLATANAARFVGADVLFADVDPETGLMMPEHVEAVLHAGQCDRVKAVFPVHLNGQVGDPAGIAALSKRYGFGIVEDACHALGSSYTSGDVTSSVGACDHADLATFSFHPVKTIACGEGGMVTGRDEALVSRIKRLRSHGMTRDERSFTNTALGFEDGVPNPWYYEMPELGYNYRLSDIHCALGSSQLGRVDEFVARRRSLVARYVSELAHLAPIVRPITQRPECQASWHLFVVHVEFDAMGLTRSCVMKALAEKRIGSQVHYIPVCRQPYYRKLYGEQTLPGADAYYQRCLSLPLFAEMAESDVDRVVAALGEIIQTKV